MSTEEQTLEGQLRELRKFARGRGWKLCGEYSDKESGALAARAGYQKLLHEAALNWFDVVVVWAIDRFGRNLVELLRSLEQLEQLGVRFVSLRESHVDTTRPEGKLMLQLLACFAQFEQARLSERTKVGVAEWRRKHGGQWGPPRTGPTVDQVKEQLELGLSKRAIARKFECSESLIRLRSSELTVARPGNGAQRTGAQIGARRRARRTV